MGKPRVAYFYHEEIGNYYYGMGHPMKPHRVRMTHDLVASYGLLDKMELLVPAFPSVHQLTRFHSDDYVDFLQMVTSENIAEYGDQIGRYNVGEDCPVFDGLWEFCGIYSGGSIGGAQKLMEDNYDVAINWAGGLHHGKKYEASGFCYINDCVLAALEFLRYQNRILYVDIDVHHGDGVEEAFYSTPRVMSCSFHKYGDYFPGTGAINDIGVEEGVGYSVNVPLKEGVDDETFIMLFEKVMTLIMQQYRPQAIILQSGADSLSGDRLGCFNLSLKGHEYAVRFLKTYGIPLLILGGGGYTLRNVPKCWTNETSALFGDLLYEDIPISAEYYGYYGPDYKMNVPVSNMENKNERTHLENIFQEIAENFRTYVFPFGSSISAIKNTSPTVEVCKTLDLEDFSHDEHLDKPMKDILFR